MTIIDFAKAKAERTPHCTGAARCLQCGHEWTATVPAGELRLECPECHTHKGTFIGNCYPQDGLVWVCQCGNELFLLTPDGDLCPICGTYSDHE